MNTPKTSQKEYTPSGEPNGNLNRNDFPSKPDPSPRSEIPRRASSMTPVLMDMLARVEGVARWGLNE